MKIAVIEDEPNIRELLQYNLEQSGYDVISAEDGASGHALVLSERPDLILLDLMLPEKNGLDLCRELRESGDLTPIIMLTAKTEEIDRILGLEFGADDYISKPFSSRELLSRIKAVLRRTGSQTPEKITQAEVIRINNLVIDPDRHEVLLETEKITLTLKEFELLTTLAKNRGRVLTRDMLLDAVWGYEYIGETRTVDVHIRYLRKKLHDEDETFIKTIRGVGYKML